MNELLFFLTAIVSFSMVLISYRIFGKKGVYAWIGFATVIANIEVVKCVDIFSLPVTLGNILYGSTFLATDILSEMYGGRESRRGVFMGFFALVCFTILMQFSLAFIPNDSDFASEPMRVIFSLSPRICVSSVCCYFMSNTLDTYLFEWIKTRSDRLWLRNNLATMTCQLFDSIMFTFAAFLGVFPRGELWLLAFTTYAVKVIVAMLDTPFLYWAKRVGTVRRYKGLEA